MKHEHRREVRFDDIGKVDSQEICLFPGVLVDISLQGCKVRFPITIDVDMEQEYELKITPARKGFSEPFFITVHPMWQKDAENSSEIGFSVLTSPGIKQFTKYVEKIAEDENDED